MFQDSEIFCLFYTELEFLNAFHTNIFGALLRSMKFLLVVFYLCKCTNLKTLLNINSSEKIKGTENFKEKGLLHTAKCY